MPSLASGAPLPIAANAAAVAVAAGVVVGAEAAVGAVAEVGAAGAGAVTATVTAE